MKGRLTVKSHKYLAACGQLEMLAWITLEVNGSAVSLVFDFEDMNRLKFISAAEPIEKQGLRDVLVTEAHHPCVGNWWPHGHILGYEHTFVNSLADFVKGVVSERNFQPTLADGLASEKVLAGVEESQKTRRWVSV